MIFNNSFFLKHQKRLLQIANSRFSRWILGLNRLPEELKDWKIDKITPSSIHRTIVNGKTFKVEHQASFFSRNRFGEALAYNLSPFCYFQARDLKSWKWKFSPVGAFGALTLLWLSLRHDVSFLGFGLIGTTSTYSPTTQEGRLISYSDADDKLWADVRDGWAMSYLLTGDYWGANDNGGSSAFILKDGNGRWNFGRTYVAFDTTGISGTVSSAFIHVVVHNHGSVYGGGVVFTKSTISSNTDLATTDWESVEYTALSDTKNYADMSNGTAYDLNLNASGISNVISSGYSKFCLMNTYDRSNSEPSGWPNGGYDWATIRASRYTGTDSDPYLSVTYTSVVAPTVTTQAVSSITPTTATGNGNITATGGENCTRRGFCYLQGSSGDPTTANSVAYDDGDFGTGAFTKSITGLSSATAYRVRAYAVNSAGTSYGSTVDLTTATAHTKSVSETVNVSEIITRSVGFKRSFSETVNLSDTFSRVVAFARSISDTVNFSEVLTKSRGIVRSFSETVNFSEAISAVKAIIRSFSETVNFSEVVTKSTGFVRAFSETIHFSEAISALKAIARHFSETIHFSENVSRTASFLRSFSETIGFSDVLTKAGLMWTKRIKPIVSWVTRTKPSTDFRGREKPATTWRPRT